MNRLSLLFLALLSAVSLSAQGSVVRETYEYATHDGQVLYLDYYSCSGSDALFEEGMRPAMIFLFGGGFVRGTRDNEWYANYFESLARRGIATFSIDYRLGLKELPEDIGVMDMVAMMQRAVNIAVEDLYAATNFILANAEPWGIDPQRIMISGSSAGAISALQAEYYRANGDQLANLLPDGFRYAGVVSCAGAIFSTKGKPKFKSSPAPMLLFHGTSDRNVPYNKASLFGVGFYGSKYVVRQLDKLDSPYYFYSEEYADHSLAGTPLYDKLDLILQFIDDYVLEGLPLRTVSNVERIGAEKLPTHFSAKEYLQSNYQR